jgi:hypothetical protein
MLGRCLFDANYRIVSGGGQGVATEVLRGVTDRFHEGQSALELGRIRTFKPVGYTLFAPPPIGEVLYFGKNWEECRKAWVTEADALIAIGGGSGTSDELRVAVENGVPIVFITGAGGTADEFAPRVTQSPLVRVVMPPSTAIHDGAMATDLTNAAMSALDEVLAARTENLGKLRGR